MKAIDQIVGLKAQRVSSKNNFIRSRLDSHNLTGFITIIFQHIQVFFLQLAIFLKAGSTTDNILAYGLLWPMSCQQKIKNLGKLILELATSTSNGNHQLLTCMPQAPHVLEGLMLISIFATHFVWAQFNQVRLPYGFNSCSIFFYFILLSISQAHATHGGNWRSVVWRVWVGSFQTFCISPTQACYQVGKGHW